MEEEKTNNTKVNALKRAARWNQRAKSFTKLVSNIPNDMMASEDPSTPLLLHYSSPYKPTPSKTLIRILVERWVSCLI